MREIYRAASRNADISYVDIYALNKKIKNMGQKYANDNFHLNDQGYNVWYTYIKSKL
jgi:lysophospholipase L1-like esterase